MGKVTRDLTPPSWRDTVGRTAERKAALGALRIGRGLLVTGAAGVGKSRFLDALGGELTEMGWDVVHVHATPSSRQVPLAVFAGLLSDLPARSQPVELLHDILMVLARRAAMGRLVLIVDDVQVLDEQSVTLVHQLASSHVAPVVLAYRAGERVPGGIEALQRDDLLEQMTLEPLAAEAALTLVARLGGASLTAAAVADICRAAEGVPLFLVTLARERLEDRGDGRTARPGPGLAAAVGVRLGRLDDDERRALETVALAEPLELDVVEKLAAADVLVRLEQRGLLRVDPSDRRLSVRLGHPLFGEVLVAELPAIRRRLLLRELVAHRSTLVPRPRRRHDLLRSVLWQLDAGDDVDVDELVGAATIAGSLGGATVAERLARLAWERRPGDETACLYALALLGVGRLVEVDRFCAALPLPALDAHRVHLAVTWSIAAFAGLGDADRAMGVIERFRSSVDPVWRSELDPIDVMIRFYTGHVGDAAAAVTAALASPHPLPARARLLLLFPGVLALAAAGCTDLAVELGAEAVASAPALAGEVALAATQAACVWGYGLYLNGRTEACVEAMETLMERSRAEMDVVAEHIFSVVRGLGLWQQGRLSDAAAAIGRLQPSADLFSLNWLPFARSWRAQCLARAGRPDEALGLLGEEAVGGPDAMHHAVAEAALAEVDVSHGDREAAALRLDRVAARAEALGQMAVGLPARLRALALVPGDERADAALAAAERHDGLVATGVADAAKAWLRRDLEAATTAAARADAGQLGLLAFDVWELARELARDVGASAVETGRIEQHLVQCRRLAGMAADGRPAGAATLALTDREREVADLAVRGQPDKLIARELGVSVRTVHAHLRAVYQKLGIAGRSELADHPWEEPDDEVPGRPAGR